MSGLNEIERRSLALHRAVAQRLLEDPRLWQRARERLLEWRRAGSRHPRFLDAWADLVANGDASDAARAIVDDSEAGQTLRRGSPFAFVLSSKRRLEVWNAARSSSGRAHAS